MDAATTKLINKIQKQEDAEHERRVRRIVRAAQQSYFLNDELNQIEAIVERAFGRTGLDH